MQAQHGDVLRDYVEKMIHDGRRAAQQPTAANPRLVVSSRRSTSPASMPLLDLIQEGSIGLIRVDAGILAWVVRYATGARRLHDGAPQGLPRSLSV